VFFLILLPRIGIKCCHVGCKRGRHQIKSIQAPALILIGEAFLDKPIQK
jgi:hypothetical protein